jgi:hypothetical protein
VPEPAGLRIVVSGMVAGVPRQGGAAWAVLQYVLGLRRLGHDVLLVEPVERDALTPAAAAYFREVTAFFGITERAALLVAGSRETVGVPFERVRAFAQDADLLLNVAGMLADEELLEPVGMRAYLDLDPGFTQLWAAEEGIDMRFGGHDRHATVGQAIGTDGCAVPTCGLGWIPTQVPVVLERWPAAGPYGRDAMTGVGNWRAYGSITAGGVHYGQKAHALRPLMALPRMTGERMVLALAIHPDERDDLARLDGGGWERVDPGVVAGTPWDYAAFVRSSRAELGVVKSGYVRSRCAWFSDRSACYLASGRPVAMEDTGIGDFLPAGEGLLLFRDLDEAAAAVLELRGDYARHSEAARAIAEEHLDSDTVLAALLDRLGAAA